MAVKKRFFVRHAKSSAALVSLGIHAVLLVVAISFVAVKVIQKEEQSFEAKPVVRPKLQLKKLQVPVTVKKKRPKPKLRKRIVAKPRNQAMPDIRMPEITGIKGGIGNAAGSGLGGAASVGFSMPEIEIFGVKGRGEKVFLILDTGNTMLEDRMGGIPAYTIIKEELIRIAESLPSTALINVAVFRGSDVQTAFPQLAPASQPNVEKIRTWLEPLNASANATESGHYGTRTLGPGGTTVREDLRIGSFAQPVQKGSMVYGSNGYGNEWFSAVMQAHKQQADTIFLLTNQWGHQYAAVNAVMAVEEWIETTSAGKKWADNVGKAQKLLAAENKRRKERGQPPKVISNGRVGLVREYFPGTQQPPFPQVYHFLPEDFAEAFVLNREKFSPEAVPAASGLRRRKKRTDKEFSFNVVMFTEKGGDPGQAAEKFTKLTGLCRGEYQTVAGLDEIQSYVSASPE